MNINVRYILIILFTAILAACKKPYAPPALTASSNYLVVEGIINNSSTDLTLIKLSRTTKISAQTVNKPEVNAKLSLEGEDGSIYNFTESQRGNYTVVSLNLNHSKKYRLRIKTSNGKVYCSDFLEVKDTPMIDSVGFIAQNNQLNIYANTHDPANKSLYYKWDYDEAWEFTSLYFSGYFSDGKTINRRTPDQWIFHCWGNDISSTIVLGSSAKLKQDIIFQQPITSIPSTSEKIEIKYSILVRQYAITKDAFNFWQNLKKNTEQLGAIFDAQPSQLAGNIHAISNATEPVIGYLSICNVQQKRIFIPNLKLPQSWRRIYPYECSNRPDTAFYCRPGAGGFCHNEVVASLIPISTSVIPIDAVTDDKGKILGYTYVPTSCADCTIRGITKKPVFWE